MRYQADARWEFGGYVVDGPHNELHEDGSPIFDYDEVKGMPDVGVVVPIGDPRGRRSVFDRLAHDGIAVVGARGDTVQLVHPSVEVGEGSLVSSTTRVGPYARIGRGVLVVNDLIAHDVEVGDYSTLSPGATVLGHVIIGAGVHIGGGAVIHNGTALRPLIIGDGAVIGVGAVVDGNVPAGARLASAGALTLRELAMLRKLVGGQRE